MYSAWPQEGEFVIEEQQVVDYSAFPDMQTDLEEYGMINLDRDPTCAGIFVNMLKSRDYTTKEQGLAAIAKAIRYLKNKARLMKHKKEILRQITRSNGVLKVSRDKFAVSRALVIVREMFRGGEHAEKDRLTVLERIADSILIKKKWVESKGHPSSPIVVREAALTIKQLVSSGVSDKERDLLQRIMTNVESYCKTSQQAGGECPLRQYQQSYDLLVECVC